MSHRKWQADPALQAFTGRLDRLISEMKLWAQLAAAGQLDEADRQTLKHHAEDVKAIGDYTLQKLNQEAIV